MMPLWLITAGLNAKSDMKWLWSKLKLIPWQVWAALALVLVFWYMTHRAYEHGYAAGVAHQQQVQAAADAKAQKHADKQTQQAAVSAAKTEVKYVETVRTIHDAAAALRLRGPANIIVHMPADGSAATGFDASGQARIGADLASIQIGWPELVDHAEQCDIYRAQVTGLQEYVTGQYRALAQPKSIPIPDVK